MLGSARAEALSKSADLLWHNRALYLSVFYDVDIEASACVLSSRYAMLCYAVASRCKNCTLKKTKCRGQHVAELYIYGLWKQ